MFKKATTLFLSSLLIVSLLSSCGNKSNTPTAAGTSHDGRTILELWDWWGDGQYKHVIEQLCTNFNESQNKYEVVHVNYPWGDVWTKALAATAAGTPPDIIIQDIRTVTHRAKAQQATNLQELVDAEGEGFADKFYPQLWDAMLYEGDAYGLPYVTDTRILYYDKDMFAEVGLDPESPPTTWAELVEYSRKLDIINDDGSIERAGFIPNTLDWDVWAYMADGKDLVDSGGNVWVNTPEKVQMFENIYNDFFAYYGTNELLAFRGEFESGATNPFVMNKVAMWINTPTEFTSVRDYAPDKNWGVALVPSMDEDKEHYSWGGGFSVEIPYGAKDVEGSFEFAKFITNTESQVYWAENVYDTVANMEAGADPKLLDIPVYAMAMEAMPTTIVTMDRLIAPGAKDLLVPNLDEIFLGNISPQQALDTAQLTIEELVEQNK